MNKANMELLHLKLFLSTLVFTLFLMSGKGQCNEGVPAEVPTMVKLSNKAINRIVCSGEFSDLIYSDNKGISGKFSKNSAFIEFIAEEIGGKFIYPTEPAEIYAVCDGVVYTIIAAPTAGINATVVRLAAPKSNIVAKNIDRFKNMPIEKQALQVIREAYAGVYPSSYRISDQSGSVNICPDLEINSHQHIDVDGIGLRLKEYRVTAKNTVDIDERMFLNNSISDAILGVAVEKHKLSTGESSRVFIVEKKALEEQKFGIEHSEVNFRLGASSQ